MVQVPRPPVVAAHDCLDAELGIALGRVHVATPRLGENYRLKRVNLTDEDAHLMKIGQGTMPAYNAQTVVSPLSLDAD